MTASARAVQKEPTKRPRNVPPLDGDSMARLLRTMMVIRVFEDRARDLFREGVIKGTAHSAVGQEAIAVGACAALKHDDFIVSHHRGHGHCIAKGASINRMMAELMGRVDGHCRGLGGSMHIADLDLNVLGANGIVGAGIGLGTGAALAAKQRGKGDAGIVFFGDGASNEGIFHEAINLAAIWRLPVVFLCENNQYGLSMPMKNATAGGSVAGRATAYGIPGELIDGNDIEAVYEAVSEAVARARQGEGPTLIEALTYRWGDHSMRANLPRYRPEAEELDWKARDPIERCKGRVKDLKALSDEAIEELFGEVTSEVEATIDFAKASPVPDFKVMLDAVTAPMRPAPAKLPAPGTRELTYAQALNEALHQEMTRDPTVFMIGEDIGKVGGLFKVSNGLLDKFGSNRVIDTPISEMGIASAAVGASISGMRGIAEVQFFDFVTLMMDMIVNQAAKFRFMLGGKPRVPVVIRGPQGGGIRLAAQHSQSLEAWFAHVPGLIVIAPSTPYDAKGLLTAAIRNDNPVIFLEHKLLYLGKAEAVPEEPYEIPIGKADIKRVGKDVTVVATLAMVGLTLMAAERLAKEGIDVEVIDPRTLKPLDMDTIIASVRKTNRCLVVHEAWKTHGFGAEISARIMEDAFDWLDAPVARLAAPDLPMPYNDELERQVIPSHQEIGDAIRKLCGRA
ncbi:MAG: dehydrogenase [Alphaproteobacteria bacterium]|nr:dehydrogenase [Alphaproteobacteria bacterium]